MTKRILQRKRKVAINRAFDKLNNAIALGLVVVWSFDAIVFLVNTLSK
jgi:hypothetical protein